MTLRGVKEEAEREHHRNDTLGNNCTLKTVSCGMLQVSTAQERTYISRHSFTELIAGSPGEKNIPSLWGRAREKERIQ